MSIKTVWNLGGVQPVLQFLSAADVRQDESVETVFTCQSQQGPADPDAQQHKKTRKVTDPHLKSLRKKKTRKSDEEDLLNLC